MPSIGILIAFATTEGQTRKIARFAADHRTGLGASVELLNAEDAEGLNLARFDGVILAASLHMGHFQKALIGFAKANGAALTARPSLFLPVSLSAVGDDDAGRKGLEDCVAQFVTETLWRPGQIRQVAGALHFKEYDFFKACMMRRIAASKGKALGAGGDMDYTDWPGLEAGLTAWQVALKSGC